MKVFFVLQLAAILIASEAEVLLTTCDRIIQHGYPCETHSVQTCDGYILTLFRIPYSHRSPDHSDVQKPVIFMMHCILCSSDIWVLNGPSDGLPFMLADAGYDVWLGNARGNVYSKNHVTLSTLSLEFWSFSWDEIGLYDLPANIDYILATTEQKRLHFVGYSQGTVAFLVLQSSKPAYGSKIKSSHLIGPAVLFCYSKSPVVFWTHSLFGRPGAANNLLGTINCSWLYKMIRYAGPFLCDIFPFNRVVCNYILQTFAGWESPHLNQTLLRDLIATMPADGALRQALHFLQLHRSCDFKAYDFGRQGNIDKYGTPEAPNYNLKNIRLQTPMEMYYCDNDHLVSMQDLRNLSDILGNQAILNEVAMANCNHFDLVLSYNVKTAINDNIVDRIQQYENGYSHTTLSNQSRNKHKEIL